MTRAELAGWGSWRRIATDGAVDSEQRVLVGAAVVERNEDGARRLAASYWDELNGFGRRLFSTREHSGGVDVRLLRSGPVLLALGPVETEISRTTTAASHPILGGLLVRRRGGRISFEQLEGEPIELRSRISGFYPRRGPFYGLVQWKLHVAVSRRYFRRLIGGEPA
jgi:hypothetical protein